MIIKSHIRGGYRSAAQYLKEVGQNEKIRLVEISDIDAKTLDEAFHNMWVVASSSRVEKTPPSYQHQSFQRRTPDRAQVLKIVERAEKKYGYQARRPPARDCRTYP